MGSKLGPQLRCAKVPRQTLAWSCRCPMCDWFPVRTAEDCYICASCGAVIVEVGG